MYAFHMPLFFICAGCMIQMTDNKTHHLGGYLSFLKKKILRLSVPYISFSLVSLALKLLFSSFTRSSVDLCSSIYGIFLEGKYFWFLYVMFEVVITIELLKRMKLKTAHMWLVAIVFYLLGQYLNTNFLCLNRLGYYLLFTLIGITCYKVKPILDMLLKRWYLVLMLMGIFVGVFMLKGSESIFLNEIIRIILALCGTGLTYSLCLATKNTQGRFTSLTSYLGVNSLAIYLVHMINQLPVYYLVAKMNISPPIISVLMIFLITTLITYYMVETMLRIPFCCYLIGMSPRKN